MASGSAGRVEAITRAGARTRLKTARMYLTAAELIVDEAANEAATVATGNAVLAGIAAADAICSDASGEWYRGPDHWAAADHLERVTGDKARSHPARARRPEGRRPLRRQQRQSHQCQEGASPSQPAHRRGNRSSAVATPRRPQTDHKRTTNGSVLRHLAAQADTRKWALIRMWAVQRPEALSYLAERRLVAISATRTG